MEQTPGPSPISRPEVYVIWTYHDTFPILKIKCGGPAGGIYVLSTTTRHHLYLPTRLEYLIDC